MHKMSTSDDKGREPPYKPQVAPPRRRGGNRFRGTVRNPKLALSYSNRGTNGFKRNNGRPQSNFQSNSSRGRYSDRGRSQRNGSGFGEVEVDLTKVQMLADQGLLVRQFQEMPQDVIIARNQATYHDSVKDAKKMNID